MLVGLSESKQAVRLPPHRLLYRTARAPITADRTVFHLDLQRSPQPRLLELDPPAARLLSTAMDDARLRRVLGLGTGAPLELEVDLCGPGLPDRRRLLRRRTTGAVCSWLRASRKPQRLGLFAATSSRSLTSEARPADELRHLLHPDPRDGWFGGASAQPATLSGRNSRVGLPSL